MVFVDLGWYPQASCVDDQVEEHLDTDRVAPSGYVRLQIWHDAVRGVPKGDRLSEAECR